MLRIILLVLLFTSTAQADRIWVTDLADDTNTSNGTCNLREAITAANNDAPSDACPAGNGTDDIYFAKTGTITLVSELPFVTGPTNIIGPGLSFLTIDANNVGRVIRFDSANLTDFTLRGVTITGGLRASGNGGGVFVGDESNVTISDATITDNTAERGGGLYVDQGSVALEQVTVSENEATFGDGGGLYNFNGSLNISNSTLIDNIANTSGGGIFSRGILIVSRSTLCDNMADENGGGIMSIGITSSSQTAIRHSTITENTSGVGSISGDGGGLYYIVTSPNNFDLRLKNTILAGNTDLVGPDIRPDIYLQNVTTALPVTEGYNLIGDRTGDLINKFPAGNPNVNNDYVGTGISPLVISLAALNDTGGPTLTRSPLSDNLIDQGACPGEPYDQRGTAGDRDTPIRIVDRAQTNAFDGCDIGAVELGAFTVPTELNLKVFLDGAYDAGQMTTGLNTAALLPLVQPYGTPPWNYGGGDAVTGPPPNMVDWLLMTMSRGGPMDPGGTTTILRRAYYVESNGQVFATPNTNTLRLDPGDYYITLEHRNHLGILSAIPVYVKWGEIGTFDFRTALNQAFSAGGIAMRDRGNGDFTMWGGDGDASGGTTSVDFLNSWLPINGAPPGYNGGDFNLDGSGTAFDFLNTWIPANGQASQVP